MYENKNKQNTGTKTIKKIEIMQDKLKRIMLREMESEK